MTNVFVIAQGGGPTAVINQTVAGAALEVRRLHPRAKVLGARHGVRGIRKGDFVDLSALSDDDLRRVGDTPNSALGSTRDKPDPAYRAEILEGLGRAGAHCFIYIGGNDTASTLHILDEAGSGMVFIHAPKTIDNDLVENDHTPGFISAAWFVASAFQSADLDFRAMPGIYAGIVMGRHAGFLTAAGAAWRRDDSDGPHLVYVPEHRFSTEQLIADVHQVRDRYGRCVIAMSEGVHGKDGRPLLESLIHHEKIERDAHGNVQLSGGDLGLAVQAALNEAFPKVRARVDTFGYLPRAFSGMISDVDRHEAFEVGAFAVRASDRGSCSVAVQHDGRKTVLHRVPLEAVAAKTRHMPRSFMDYQGNTLTEEGRAYMARLVPPAPEIAPPLI